jgi:methyltransferase (TIGR00027 family)
MSSSYSVSLSDEPSRQKARTTFGPYCLLRLAPSSNLWDTTLGHVSIISYTGCSLALFGGMISLIPSMIVSKYVFKWSSMVNPPPSKHLSTIESLTAIKTLSARSQMALQGSGGRDYLAPALMAQVSLCGRNIPGSGLFTKFYLFCQRLHFYATGRIFADQMTYFGRKKLGIPFGETAFLQVRTCWIDDCLETFLDKYEDANVVVLGAGYDSRCYRFQRTGVAYFEVDAPATQAAKLQALQKAGISTKTVSYVPCDFESQDWIVELDKTGKFDANKPTFCVWEGVTPYLERQVVVNTIEKAGQCGKGSVIAFDYFDKRLLTKSMVQAAAKATNERWKFGLANDEIDDLVKECNNKSDKRNLHELKIVDHLKTDELIRRYCAKHFDGRSIGFLEDFGGFLLIGSNA